MIPTFRVPFWLKVLLSYFAVVAAGAIPALLYLQVSFHDQLLEDRAAEMARRGAMLSEQLRPLGDADCACEVGDAGAAGVLEAVEAPVVAAARGWLRAVARLSSSRRAVAAGAFHAPTR